jgi:DnaK suppressor protein
MRLRLQSLPAITLRERSRLGQGSSGSIGSEAGSTSSQERQGELVVDTSDLERFRQLLLAKQHDLLAARSGGGTLVPAARDSRPDPIDQATAETETKVQVRLRQTESHLLRAIEEALARIDHGTFGVCQACGQLIAPARLNAVPWTRLCRGCKEQEKG